MFDIRNMKFGELFGIAFAVGLAFDLAILALGVALAFLAPGTFHSGPAGAQVAATSPLEAIGILILLEIFAVLGNLMVSSAGAGLIVIFSSLGILGKAKPVRAAIGCDVPTVGV